MMRTFIVSPKKPEIKPAINNMITNGFRKWKIKSTIAARLRFLAGSLKPNILKRSSASSEESPDKEVCRRARSSSVDKLKSSSSLGRAQLLISLTARLFMFCSFISLVLFIPLILLFNLISFCRYHSTIYFKLINAKMNNITSKNSDYKKIFSTKSEKFYLCSVSGCL